MLCGRRVTRLHAPCAGDLSACLRPPERGFQLCSPCLHPRRSQHAVNPTLCLPLPGCFPRPGAGLPDMKEFESGSRKLNCQHPHAGRHHPREHCCPLTPPFQTHRDRPRRPRADPETRVPMGRLLRNSPDIAHSGSAPAATGGAERGTCCVKPALLTSHF